MPDCYPDQRDFSLSHRVSHSVSVAFMLVSLVLNFFADRATAEYIVPMQDKEEEKPVVKGNQ